jgi:hypothetical protein
LILLISTNECHNFEPFAGSGNNSRFPKWAGNGGVDDEATKIIAEREEKIYRFR